MTLGRNRIEGLDLLRGIAIGLVMLRHAWPNVFGGAGLVGVTVFFTLSGYLITGLIVGEIKRHNTVKFGRFYRNRALRLFPAMWALLAIWAAVEIARPGAAPIADIVKTVVIGVCYVANLPLGINPDMAHLWTLATEEQFYLVWPAVLLLAARRRVSLVWTCVSVVAMLTAACWLTLLIAPRPEMIYDLPTTWGSTLAFGGLGYLIKDRFPQRPIPYLATVGGLVLAGLSLIPDAKSSAATYLIWPTLIAACSLALILFAVRWQRLPSRALVPLLSLGTVSYGAYLWNWPIAEWVRHATGVNYGQWSWLTVPLTIVAAYASWYTAEFAGRTMRRRLDFIGGSQQHSVSVLDRRGDREGAR